MRCRIGPNQTVDSEAVLAELSEGDYDLKDKALGLVAGLELLEVPDEVADIIDVYLDNRLMPRDRLGDALHLALASYHKCDSLLTWNCQHIANANKFEHIRSSIRAGGDIAPEYLYDKVRIPA
jgi:predicted nucleic acid-binding protein